MSHLIDLSNCSNGYTIIKATSLREQFEKLIFEHIKNLSGELYSTVDDFTEAASEKLFPMIKDKQNRIFSEEIADRALRFIDMHSDLRIPNGGFITDEDDLGYPNIYWRFVRANSKQDVGSIHADEWFWDLGHGKFPNGYKRVKVWLPIVQDNENPSLLILPSSHQNSYKYEFIEDENGKRRPIFSDQAVTETLKPAPIKIGEAIVFNDRLLHGGQSTKKTRISIEWTYGIPLN